MNLKFCFVILHYKTLEETKKCVDSILKNCNNDDINIIIVDNFSNDGSNEKLEALYNKYYNVKIIVNNINLGFARGNNVGFLYAKKNYKSDFIILLNSDAYVMQSNFCEIICNEFNKSNFVVLGPKVFTPYSNNGCCNPMRKQHIDEKEINRYILKFKLYIILNYFKLDLQYIKFKEYLKQIFKISNSTTNFADYDIRMTDVQLHGCCLIFSSLYIDKYDGLNDKTFLYMEEDLLFIEMHKNNLLTVYNPDLKIFHSEGLTSAVIDRKPRKQRKNKYKNIVKSCQVVKETLKSYK